MDRAEEEKKTPGLTELISAQGDNPGFGGGIEIQIHEAMAHQRFQPQPVRTFAQRVRALIKVIEEERSDIFQVRRHVPLIEASGGRSAGWGKDAPNKVHHGDPVGLE